jgi:hypothetical protein
MGVHMARSLKNIKNHIIFPRKNSKKYVFACIFGFSNQFSKTMRTASIFQKYQKLILFFISIWDYELIREIYFRY